MEGNCAIGFAAAEQLLYAVLVPALFVDMTAIMFGDKHIYRMSEWHDFAIRPPHRKILHSQCNQTRLFSVNFSIVVWFYLNVKSFVRAIGRCANPSSSRVATGQYSQHQVKVNNREMKYSRNRMHSFAVSFELRKHRIAVTRVKCVEMAEGKFVLCLVKNGKSNQSFLSFQAIYAIRNSVCSFGRCQCNAIDVTLSYLQPRIHHSRRLHM